MTAQRILSCIFAAILLAEAKFHTKEDTICNVVLNTTNKIQCYCTKDQTSGSIREADCSLNTEIDFNSEWWQAFTIFKRAQKLSLTNARGIPLKYIPTDALKHTQALLKFDVTYGHVEKIQPYAFANLSSLRELKLSDNRIHTLEIYAFAEHMNLTSLNLDKNLIEEIKRDVFVHLPNLEKLFLTSNKIAIIHDKAFAHLENLKELELNINEMISLNSESFYGLKNLQTLDLSSNNLEVLGDNTFMYLENLLTLNLEGNKIQMFDERAFQGLFNLRALSLAHNKIAEIDSLMLFQGLNKLISLNLKANEIKEFPTEVMAPILKNFYETNAHLDVEDNPFPCTCGLNWFASLMNKTKSNLLKIAMDNIKCLPSSELRDAWSKIEEREQNSRPTYDNPDIQQGQDYEYYDETQLNGKLFFTDIKDLLNCTNNTPYFLAGKPEIITSTFNNKANPDFTRHQLFTASDDSLTKKSTGTTPSNPPVTTHTKTTEKTKELITKQGKTTEKTKDFYLKTHRPSITTVDDDRKDENKANTTSLYTTSRLATVSAKPIEEKSMPKNRMVQSIEDKPVTEHRITKPTPTEETRVLGDRMTTPIEDKPVPDDRMASDEAVPEKTHRSIHQEYKSPNEHHGASHRNLASLLHISMLLLFRLVY